ncbi:MAG: hypothetical protein QE274_10365 [Verrucomicrobiaceae bacterium]|nr:hypothetical protein [Verrucomicrobiaceae bacterium]
MKLQFPAALLAITLLPSCGLMQPKGQPTPQSAMRYDTVSRAWVPLNAPTVRPATIAPHNLAPENNAETAKIITAPTPAGTEDPVADEPSFLNRIGRAATSPLRAVGIGDN